MRFVLCCILITFLLLTYATFAQDANSGATATCNFDADKQLVAGYQIITINPKKQPLGREIPTGKVWAPGGKPMTLLTNTPVEIGGQPLAAGGYTMFVIPSAKQWMLIVSKSTDTSGKYDESMDLVRVPMESGELPAPEPQFHVSFAHDAPGQCSLRLDVATLGNWAIFKQK
jgi:Protein of unknown function (DUF2911)